MDERNSAAPTGGLRIAMVTPRHLPFIGGVETHVDRLSAALSARGHSVDIFTQRTDDASPASERHGGVQIRRYPGLLSATPYPISPHLWHAVWSRRRAFDIIHGHGYHALAALVGPLTRTPARPFVMTPHYHATGHTRLARALHPAYRPLGAQLIRRADTVISVSQIEADLLARDFAPRPDQARVVIPNGVDLEAILSATPFELDGVNALCVGRLAAYKNVGRVIDSIQLLPSPVHLWIIGDGPVRQELEARSVADRVTFLGRVSDEDLHRWYRSADVCVNLSAHEAFGIVLLEQLAAGSRVVASSIPAHLEVSGFSPTNAAEFVDPGISAEDLSNVIAHAAESGRPAAPDTRTIPTWDAVAERTETAYVSALSQTSGHAGT